MFTDKQISAIASDDYSHFAVDIDNCLADFSFGFLEVLRDITGIDRFAVPIASYDFAVSLGISSEMNNMVMKSNEMIEKYRHLPIKKDVLDFVKALAEQKKKITYVTARSVVCSSEEQLRQLKDETYDWLADAGVPFGAVIFSGPTKGNVAEARGIDCAIDDSPTHIEEYIHRNIPVFVPRYPYTELYVPSKPDLVNLF